MPTLSKHSPGVWKSLWKSACLHGDILALWSSDYAVQWTFLRDRARKQQQ